MSKKEFCINCKKETYHDLDFDNKDNWLKKCNECNLITKFRKEDLTDKNQIFNIKVKCLSNCPKNYSNCERCITDLLRGDKALKVKEFKRLERL